LESSTVRAIFDLDRFMFVLANYYLLSHTRDVALDPMVHVRQLFVLFLRFKNLSLVPLQLCFDRLDLLILKTEQKKE